MIAERRSVRVGQSAEQLRIDLLHQQLERGVADRREAPVQQDRKAVDGVERLGVVAGVGHQEILRHLHVDVALHLDRIVERPVDRSLVGLRTRRSRRVLENRNAAPGRFREPNRLRDRWVEHRLRRLGSEQRSAPGRLDVDLVDPIDHVDRVDRRRVVAGDDVIPAGNIDDGVFVRVDDCELGRLRGCLRQEDRELSFEVDETGEVLDGYLVSVCIAGRHRETIGDHHGEEPVVVTHHQLGVVDVDLASVSEQRHVLLRGQDLVDHRLAHRQVVTELGIGDAVEHHAWSDAISNGLIHLHLGLTLGDEHERQPRCGARLAGKVALPRQRSALDHDLRQAGSERPFGVRRRERRQHLVGWKLVARRADADERVELLHRQVGRALVARSSIGAEQLIGTEAIRTGLQWRIDERIQLELALTDGHRSDLHHRVRHD